MPMSKQIPPMDITPSHAHPMSFRKAFLPQRPQTRGQPKDTQPGPAPGTIHKHQPSPTQFLPAPEATESEKVSRFHATLHSSGMRFLILSSFLSCIPCLRVGKLLLCAGKGQMSHQILSALLRKL